MNINKLGEEICIIKDDPNNKNTAIYLYEGHQEEHKLVKFFEELTIEAGYFQVVPDKKKDRTSIYIAGQNGSGKSYWIYQYLQEFIKRFPTYKIFMFSSKNHDENLDKITKLKRVVIDDTFITNPINYELLKESLCIFDDIDALSKKIKDAVYELRDRIFNNGRSYHIHIIATSHQLSGKENMVPIREANIITFFLKNYNKNMRYFLENYVGLELEQIKKLRKVKTRATTLIKTMPNVILQERNLYTFDSL